MAFSGIPSSYYGARTSIEANAQSITLTGGPYKHLRIWLDSGSSAIGLDFRTTATEDDPRIDDSMVHDFPIDEPGLSTLYYYGVQATGTINLLAWGI